MKLYLIRHGESQGNVDRGFIAGRTDPKGLTVKGRAQVARTAWELRQTPIEKIYTSPVARAKESAAILGALWNVPVEEAPFLQEMSYGKFEGKYFWEMMDEMRPAFERWNKEMHYAFPGGESLGMVSDRVWNGYRELSLDCSKDANVVFVSHDAVLSTLLFSLTFGHPAADDLTPSYKRAFMRFVHGTNISNASCTVVDIARPAGKSPPSEFPSTPAPVSRESLLYYSCGVLGDTWTELKEKITASENKVYHISAAGDAIVKLMEERDIVASERIVEIYRYLEKKTEIPAPRVRAYDASHAFFADTVLVQDYIEGRDQNEALTGGECGKETVARAYELLKRIHAIPSNEVAEFWYPDDATHKVHLPWKSFICGEIAETIRAVPYMGLPEAAYTSLIDDLEALMSYASQSQYGQVPLHGDFAPQNLIVAPGGRVERVVDFERARIGDPLWDMAYYYGWLQRKDIALADAWRRLIDQDVKEHAGIFGAYVSLFHAWTVRDVSDYTTSTLRARRAKESRDLLAARFGGAA
jgi:broad specificity phosphatase PhoE/aminoglycoside phosphotransferase (APT) family kinase protein